MRAATLLSLPVALAFASLYALAGGALVDAMTVEPEVRALAREWLPWIVAAPLVGVWSFLLDGIFVGATRTREMRATGMLLSLGAFLLATWTLVPLFGNDGLWAAYHVLLATRALTLAIRYRRVSGAADGVRG